MALLALLALATAIRHRSLALRLHHRSPERVCSLEDDGADGELCGDRRDVGARNIARRPSVPELGAISRTSSSASAETSLSARVACYWGARRGSVSAAARTRARCRLPG